MRFCRRFRWIESIRQRMAAKRPGSPVTLCDGHRSTMLASIWSFAWTAVRSDRGRHHKGRGGVRALPLIMTWCPAACPSCALWSGDSRRSRPARGPSRPSLDKRLEYRASVQDADLAARCVSRAAGPVWSAASRPFSTEQARSWRRPGRRNGLAAVVPGRSALFRSVRPGCGRGVRFAVESQGAAACSEGAVR